MMTNRKKRLAALLGERFGEDPVALRAIHQAIEADFSSRLNVETAKIRSELMGSHRTEIAALSAKSEAQVESAITSLTTKFEKKLEEAKTELGKETDDKLAPTDGRSKSVVDRLAALEGLMSSRYGKLDNALGRMRERMQKFTDYVVGAPNRSFYVNGSLPSVYFSDTNLVAGSGITLTPSTNQVNATADVTISATGAAGDSVFNEVVSGSGTSWALANTPIDGTVTLYARGQRLTPGVDYNISGANIVTIDSWNAGDLLADYQKQP